MDTFTSFVTGFFISAMASAVLVTVATESTHRADLIQRGLAEYCAADGRFAFKGEC